ncbi:hypothetical protein D3C72_1334450 [compost metagenome]
MAFASRAHLVFGPAAQHQHGRFAQVGVFAHGGQERATVHARHGKVGDHQVRAHRQHLLQRGQAVGVRRDLVTFVAKELAQHLDQHGLIVDNKNFRHGVQCHMARRWYVWSPGPGRQRHRGAAERQGAGKGLRRFMGFRRLQAYAESAGRRAV